MKSAYLFLVLALLFTALIPRALAEGIDNETITDDDDPVRNRIWRTFKVFTQPGTIMLRGVRSERSGFDFKRDVIVVGASINKQTSFGYSYYNSEGDISDDDRREDDGGSFSFSASRIGGFIRFLDLVEYLEANGEPGFQPNGDTVLSNMSLTPMTHNGEDLYHPLTWGSATYNDSTTGAPYTVYWIDVMSLNGVLHVRGYASAKPVWIDSRSLTPDHWKLTVDIDYWNPNNTVASTNPNASLALVAVYATMGAQTFRNRTSDDDNHEGVDSEGDDVASGTFDWELFTTVTCHNETAENETECHPRLGRVTTQFIHNLDKRGSGPFGCYGRMVSRDFDDTWTLGLLVHDLNVTYGEKFSWDPTAHVNVDYYAAVANAVNFQVSWAVLALVTFFVMFF